MRHKRTRESSERADLYRTSLSPVRGDALTLARVSWGRWGIENQLHHKRDTVLGEDTRRTRKAAQVMATLSNLLLSFFHQIGLPVLRTIRRFAVNPTPPLPVAGRRRVHMKPSVGVLIVTLALAAVYTENDGLREILSAVNR